MTGADLLAALVKMCTGPTSDPRLHRASTVQELAELLQASSSSVTSKLAHLADAGLVYRSRPARIVRGQIVEVARVGPTRVTQVYTPTDRGATVDAILARITVARGGRFKPRTSAGVTLTESLALR